MGARPRVRRPPLSSLWDVPLSRRRLLGHGMRALGGGLAVGGLSACDPLGRSKPAPRPRRPPPPPDPVLELLAAERVLLDQYDAVIARFPGLARIAAVRADHAAHAVALRTLVRTPVAATPAPVGVPATAAAALAALRAAELSVAARTTAACIAGPASRAPLLGSIAACESAHLVLLR